MFWIWTCVLLLTCNLTSVSCKVRVRTKNSSIKANIILILTDDQDKDLGSLQFMPKVAKYLGGGGATYQNGYSTTPMCCPSRSSLLTGLYAHNHHVYTNNNNCSSQYWQENHEKKTFSTYLQRAGYRTAYYGKYLNKYTGHHIPPGWDEWQGLVKNSRFYNYTINSNGKLKYHGNNYQDDYLPDLITNKTLELISASARSSGPFLAVLSYPGPHGPEDAAPQYQDMFLNVTTHHTPAYDFAPNPDKQWILRHTEKMLPIQRSFTDMLMTKRLQTLQTVDSAVEKIVEKLESTGELRNTYIFYTSDHGYHLGQFGLVKGKAFPFDFDTHVPFFVRGPGVPPGSIRNQPVLNIDLAPTFLDIAGLPKPPHMDGKSFLPTLTKPNKRFRDAFLIERGKMSKERYEMVSQNKIGSIDGSIYKKDARESRLSALCDKKRYEEPCKQGQKFVCRTKDDGSIKIGRCKNKRTSLDYCHCNPGKVFGWHYLKQDVGNAENSLGYAHKNFIGKKVRKSVLKRIERSIPDLHPDILDGVVHDEIKEVDFLVEDIAMEIHGLGSKASSASCIRATNNVTCEGEDGLLEKPYTWVTSRNTIKHQIQQLRAQLNELKQIRRYLKLRRPDAMEKVPARKAMKSGSSLPVTKPGVGVCICNTDNNKKARKQERIERRRERKFERMLLRERKRKQMEKEKTKKLHRNDHCKIDMKINCFSHDNDHWKSAPLWTEGPFCACTNSNNNTYWCARTINSTHNYLYCEYVTGMITYFDLRVDPFQLRNLLYTLPSSDLTYMHDQVTRLRNYSGKSRYLKIKRKQNLHKNKKRNMRMRSMRIIRSKNLV